MPVPIGYWLKCAPWVFVHTLEFHTCQEDREAPWGLGQSPRHRCAIVLPNKNLHTDLTHTRHRRRLLGALTHNAQDRALCKPHPQVPQNEKQHLNPASRSHELSVIGLLRLPPKL